MATINGLTAEAMQAIRNGVIVSAHIDGDDLILVTFDSTEINAGSVRGPQGIEGPIGQVSDAELASAIAGVNATIAAHHAAGAISETELAGNSVSSGKIVDGAVTETKLADGAVTSAKIADGTITAGDLASNAVTTAKINDGAVTSVKIANGTITESDLNAGMCTEQAGAALNGWGGTIYYWKAGNLVFFIYTTSTGLGAGAQTIFNFPAGYRPFRTCNFVCWNGDAAAGIVQVTAAGNMVANTGHQFFYVTGSFLAFQ